MPIRQVTNMKKILILLFIPVILLAESSGTVVEVPPSAADIAWGKVEMINAPTRIDKLRIALTADTTDYDSIKLSPLVDRLVVLELYDEGYKRHEALGKNYAPVIYQSAVNNRIKKLKAEASGD